MDAEREQRITELKAKTKALKEYARTVRALRKQVEKIANLPIQTPTVH